MKHVIYAPLCGKLKVIIDQRHHLDNLKGAVVLWHEFCVWLVGAQVASFQPHLISHLVLEHITVLDP